MNHGTLREAHPVVRDPSEFNMNSGSPLERFLFNGRRVVLAICAISTLVLGYEAAHVRLNASFDDTIPTGQAYIRNYLSHVDDLKGLGNAVRVVVETKTGTVYSAAYLATLQKISDSIFLIPGVDRNFMKSLWTPTVRWVGVTEEGLNGGPVIPPDYDGSSRSIAQVKSNVERSGEIGQTVAPDQKSTIIYVPLLKVDQATGKPLDYANFASALDSIRDKFQTDSLSVHVTGFAQLVGDLIHALHTILLYFGMAVVIAACFVFWYTRCIRSTLLVVSCSLVAVVWQLGIITLLGYDVNPYSILVPFLVFAIGMSHGVQKMNGIMQDIGRGTHRLVAARYTFRRLFLAGLTALVADAVGFGVLSTIRIKVIQDLALIAGIGVAVLIFTNLMLLPILLSYVGVDPAAALRSVRSEAPEAMDDAKHPVWHVLDLFTQRRWAVTALVVAAILGVGGAAIASHVKIGDLDAGAPELRPNSQYNRDDAYLTKHYGASSDVFAVLITTPNNGCSAYDTLMREDDLAWRLRQLPGVESTNSLALLNRQVLVGYNEGNLNWYELLDNQKMANMLTAQAPRGLYNDQCNLLTLYAYLKDHRADTLSSVANEVSAFASANDTKDVKFTLAAGNAGIEAATNIVVSRANEQMPLVVYAAVALLCLIAFRSWRAVLCALVPLFLTSILAEALMVALHIGVKVSTLPVIALGVGIGVDYSLYVMSILLARLRDGLTLSEAYYRALLFTGRVVLLTGVMLALGVGTWTLSPIKFQADMGILLAFMFLWNMLGALILLPALAYFLLPHAARQAAPQSSTVVVAS